MTDVPNIVIIGGSHAGLGAAQAILAALPTVKVILINTSKHYYFNLAAPRVLARPDNISIDQVMIPIASLFTKHGTDRFEFVHATVQSVDITGKTVTMDLKTAPVIGYDYLIIASGSHTLANTSKQIIPVKQPVTDTLEGELKKAQLDIKNAQNIVIGGSGPLAVEFAGEIADEYPLKTITVVSSASRLLPTIKESASRAATKMLKSLKVDIVFGVRVENAEYRDAEKKWTVNLSNGQNLEPDLYISAMGVLPNNNFIPAELLSRDGWVMVDENLRVVGAPAVYALGDIINEPVKMTIVIKNQVEVVATNLAADINGVGSRKAYKRGISAMIVPVGRVGGIGQIGHFVLWSWMATFIKGDFFISRNKLWVSGK
jgi:apoptosis-inducing factor 2